MGGSSTDDEWEFTSPLNGLRTLVLIGRTGNGKSATGNSILQKKAFMSRSCTRGVTSTCEMHTTVLKDGQILNVIDTPGFFEFGADDEFVGKEIVKCVNMAKDGIHAVLVVLSVGIRFLDVDIVAINGLRNLFGDKINDYMIVVFTGGDGLECDDLTLEDYLTSDCPKPLKELLDLCENRMVLFNNRTDNETKKDAQLQKLISCVNLVMTKNGGQPFTNDLFVALRKGARKLHSETAEVISSEKYSKQEISMMTEKMHITYEEQLQRLTEMVEMKLGEATSRLEQQLAEEQAARLESEMRALDAQMKSNDEIHKLRESLERAHKEAAELRELRNQAEKSKCAIL